MNQSIDQSVILNFADGQMQPDQFICAYSPFLRRLMAANEQNQIDAAIEPPIHQQQLDGAQMLEADFATHATYTRLRQWINEY